MAKTSKTAAGRSKSDSHNNIKTTDGGNRRSKKTTSKMVATSISETKATNAVSKKKVPTAVSKDPPSLSKTSIRRPLGDIANAHPNVNSDYDSSNHNTKKMAMTIKVNKDKHDAKTTAATDTTAGRGSRNRTVVKYCDDNDDNDDEDNDESDDEDTYESDYDAPVDKNKKARAKATSTTATFTNKTKEKPTRASNKPKSTTKGKKVTSAITSTNKGSAISILDETMAAPLNVKKRASSEIIPNFTQKFTREIVGDATRTTTQKKKPKQEDFTSNEDDNADDFVNVQGHERATSKKFEEEYHYRAGVKDDWRCMSACDW